MTIAAKHQTEQQCGSTARPKAFLPWVGPPLALAFSGLFLAWLAMYLNSDWAALVGFGLFGISSLYFLVQMVGRFILRQWRAGLRALACLAACALSFASVFVLIAARALARG